MGKVNLDFFFHDEKGDVISKVTFQSIEDIDLCIEKLQEARAEFEHRIEMKRLKAREKRMRSKGKRTNGNIPQEVFENLRKAEETYNKMPEYLKTVYKPILDMAKKIVEDAKNGIGA